MRHFDKIIKSKFAYLPDRLPGMSVTHEDGILLIDSGLATDMANIACCEEATDQGAVRRAVSHFRARNLPFCWWVGFDEEPKWLVEELKTLGLQESEAELGMGIDLSQVKLPIPRADWTVRRVENHQDLEALLAVMLAIFPSTEQSAIRHLFCAAEAEIIRSDSRLHFFVGSYDGKPVATSSLFISEGMAAVFDVIVLPTERGKGFGKEITLHAMRAAGEKPCVLTATNDAKYLYEKLGFREVKAMKVYS